VIVSALPTTVSFVSPGLRYTQPLELVATSPVPVMP